MAFVYWIHLKDHSDILSEGYVGITTKSVKRRFSEHLTRARMRLKSKREFDKSRSIIGHALLKYGENEIVVDTICECDINYALYMERKLRPAPLIGWNILTGGGETVGRLGLPQTYKQKNAVSKAMKGRPPCSEALRKAAEANSSRQRSEDELAKRSDAMMSKHLLDMPTTNLDVLSRVNDIYPLYLKGLRMLRVSKALCMPYGVGLRALFNRFSGGYNPLEDARLQEFISDYISKYGIYVEGKEINLTTGSTTNICTGVFKSKGSYVAYIGTGGNRVSKAFNIHNLGDDIAKQMAIQYRKELEVSRENLNNAA